LPLHAPSPRIVYRAGGLVYQILDRTLIPIDRIADDRPYYSGKQAP
jgi:hypothetical protein